MILHVALLMAHSLVATPMEAPVAKPAVEHRFYDRTAKIQLAAALALDAYDNAATCRSMDNDGKPRLVVLDAPRPGYSGEWYYTLHRENYLPTQSCQGATAILTAQLVGQELVAYLLHRTNHHKLERAARFFTIEGNAQGIIYSRLHSGKLTANLPYPGVNP